VSGQEYCAVPYSPDLLPDIAQLMVYLWGGDPEANTSYFRWKYERNPHSDEPLAVVGLRGSKVVGFRGFFATKWTAGRDQTVRVLCPSDTCVHPDHRRRGLSVLMGRAAMRLYEGRYPIFLNTSCSHQSLPGYVRMGFLPLAQRNYLAKVRLSAFFSSLPVLSPVSRILRGQGPSQAQGLRLPLGGALEFLVTDRVLPEEMAGVVAKRGRNPARLTLCQDEAYFRWRFASGRRRYSFCYLMEGQKVAGYAALRLFRRGRATIIDYGGVDENCTKTLLGAAVATLRLDVLSIWDFSVESSLRQYLSSLGFRRDSLTAFIEKRLWGEVSLPLLVRPVAESFREDDWYIGGLDVRRIESWLIREICSDAA